MRARAGSARALAAAAGVPPCIQVLPRAPRRSHTAPDANAVAPPSVRTAHEARESAEREAVGAPRRARAPAPRRAPPRCAPPTARVVRHACAATGLRAASAKQLASVGECCWQEQHQRASTLQALVRARRDDARVRPLRYAHRYPEAAAERLGRGCRRDVTGRRPCECLNEHARTPFDRLMKASARRS